MNKVIAFKVVTHSELNYFEGLRKSIEVLRRTNTNFGDLEVNEVYSFGIRIRIGAEAVVNIYKFTPEANTRTSIKVVNGSAIHNKLKLVETEYKSWIAAISAKSNTMLNASK